MSGSLQPLYDSFSAFLKILIIPVPYPGCILATEFKIVVNIRDLAAIALLALSLTGAVQARLKTSIQSWVGE